MRQKNINTALILAIALALACKKLQRHTGVYAADWQKELLSLAIDKFSQFTPYQLQKFIAANFDLES